MPRVASRSLVAALALLAAVGSARAGVHTYRDVLPGDRAASMGGAYAALADDASGAFYNPAGLVRVAQGDLSISANAFASYRLTFDDYVQDRSVTADGFSFFPTSIDSVTRIDALGERVSLGFSIVVTEDVNLSVKEDLLLTDLVEIRERLVLDFESTGQTYSLGPTLAVSITPTLSAGLTIYGVYGSLNTENSFTVTLESEQGNAVSGFFFDSNEDTKIGVTAVLGLMWRPLEELSLGLTLRPPADLSHDVEGRTTDLGINEEGLLLPGLGFGTAREGSYTEGLPAMVTVAAAGSPIEGLTLALDVSHAFREDYPGAGLRVKREPTWNVSVGGEYLVTEYLPVRAGFFTNLSAAPDVSTPVGANFAKIDQLGFTVGAAWLWEWAELSVGLKQSWLDGEGRALDDPARVVDVSGSETIVFVGARYMY